MPFAPMPLFIASSGSLNVPHCLPVGYIERVVIDCSQLPAFVKRVPPRKGKGRGKTRATPGTASGDIAPVMEDYLPSEQQYLLTIFHHEFVDLQVVGYTGLRSDGIGRTDLTQRIPATFTSGTASAFRCPCCGTPCPTGIFRLPELLRNLLLRRYAQECIWRLHSTGSIACRQETLRHVCGYPA